MTTRQKLILANVRAARDANRTLVHLRRIGGKHAVEAVNQARYLRDVNMAAARKLKAGEA